MTTYASCARCGQPMLGAGRALATGRHVCARCYEHVVFVLKRDDGVAISWEETRAHRRMLAKQRMWHHPHGYYDARESENAR